MTKREQEQLQRLLDKKQAEEAANKEFYMTVRKRRRDVLKVLDVDADAYDSICKKAAKVDVTIEQLADVIQRIPSEWIHKIIEQRQEQG